MGAYILLKVEPSSGKFVLDRLRQEFGDRVTLARAVWGRFDIVLRVDGPSKTVDKVVDSLTSIASAGDDPRPLVKRTETLMFRVASLRRRNLPLSDVEGNIAIMACEIERTSMMDLSSVIDVIRMAAGSFDGVRLLHICPTYGRFDLIATIEFDSQARLREFITDRVQTEKIAQGQGHAFRPITQTETFVSVDREFRKTA